MSRRAERHENRSMVGWLVEHCLYASPGDPRRAGSHCGLASCKTPWCSCAVHPESKQNMHASRASGSAHGSFQRKDWNRYEQALNCCVNNYLCRCTPSLRKAQSVLSSWAFTYMVTAGHLFLVFPFSPCVGSFCLICVQI